MYCFDKKNAVFQVSSMVLIHHKYNRKWDTKEKINGFQLTYAETQNKFQLVGFKVLKMARAQEKKIKKTQKGQL